jgi:hypothetical protein
MRLPVRESHRFGNQRQKATRATQRIVSMMCRLWAFRQHFLLHRGHTTDTASVDLRATPSRLQLSSQPMTV